MRQLRELKISIDGIVECDGKEVNPALLRPIGKPKDLSYNLHDRLGILLAVRGAAPQKANAYVLGKKVKKHDAHHRGHYVATHMSVPVYYFRYKPTS